MKSSNITAEDTKFVEQGRAIARGVDEIQTQKQRNMAKETKRMKTMIRNVADKEMFQ